MRINNNIMAYSAQRNLGASAMSMGKSIEKLSSGLRINRAADDASGLVISQKLRAQTSGLRQATRNAQDGISVVQTAEGGLNEVHTMLNRMRDLAVQSANTGANDTAARQAAQEEFEALRSEIDRIGTSTSFGDTNLLDGNYGSTPATQTGYSADDTFAAAGTEELTLTIGADAVTVELDAATGGASVAEMLERQISSALDDDANLSQYSDSVSVSATPAGAAGSNITIDIGLPSGDTFTLADATGTWLGDNDFGAVTAAAGTSGTFQVGAGQGGSNEIAVTIAGVSASILNLSDIDLVSTTGADTASTAIGVLDTAIEQVSTQRGDLGAVQNRLESTISNLQVTAENLAASESRIRDVDVAAEMVNFTRSQILQQAGTAMLGQANANSSSVLRLLG